MLIPRDKVLIYTRGKKRNFVHKKMFLATLFIIVKIMGTATKKPT